MTIPIILIIIEIIVLAIIGYIIISRLQAKDSSGIDAKIQQDYETRIALLQQETDTQKSRYEETKNLLENKEASLQQLRTELSLAVQAKAAAEERVTQIPKLEAEIKSKADTFSSLQQDNSLLKSHIAELNTQMEEQKKYIIDKTNDLEQAKIRLSDAFKALSAEALQQNNQSFMDLAKTVLDKHESTAKEDLENRRKSIDEMIKPIKETLEKFDGKVQQVEKDRIQSYSSLIEQVKYLAESQNKLQQETGNLVKALRAPQTRGQWGEIQLKRVVEMAGMLEYCDFEQQTSVSDNEGNRLRPDMIIRLPNNKIIVVDSKTSLQAFLEATSTQDDALRLHHLKEHASQVRNHMTQLESKKYWDQFPMAPEFVVMFLPGESFFSAALEQDPSLIEFGVERRIILSTPTTLIALLKAVAYGWKQEQIAENAQVICELGRNLYDSIGILAEHLEDVGKGLGSALNAYNKSVRSLEGRVLSRARKFKELQASTNRDIPELETIDSQPHTLQKSEFIDTLPDNQ